MDKFLGHKPIGYRYLPICWDVVSYDKLKLRVWGRGAFDCMYPCPFHIEGSNTKIDFGNFLMI